MFLFCENTHNTQNTLNPHTPIIEVIIGIIEYPKPLNVPTVTSIIPHIKYVRHMIASLDVASTITSGSEVYRVTNELPKANTTVPKINPHAITYINEYL